MSRAPKNKKALSRIFADNSKPKILAMVPEVSVPTVFRGMQVAHLELLTSLTLISWSRDFAKLLPWLQPNKKVDDFRNVLTKITKERKESFNVLWADPKTSPQASHLYPIVQMR